MGGTLSARDYKSPNQLLVGTLAYAAVYSPDKAPCLETTRMICRRLTCTETERLQGFPDGWTAEGIDAKGNRKPQADGPRYKQMGNAVTVNVAEWIAHRLIQTL